MTVKMMIDFLTHNIGGLLMLWAAAIGLIFAFFHGAAKLREREKERDER